MSRDGKRARARSKAGPHGWVTDVLGDRRRIPDLASLPVTFTVGARSGASVDVVFHLPSNSVGFWRVMVRSEDLDDRTWLQSLIRCAAVSYARSAYGVDKMEAHKPLHHRSPVKSLITVWAGQVDAWRTQLDELRDLAIAGEVMSS